MEATQKAPTFDGCLQWRHPGCTYLRYTRLSDIRITRVWTVGDDASDDRHGNVQSNGRQHKTQHLELTCGYA